MSMAKDFDVDKTYSQIHELADSLCTMIQEAATAGDSLYETEKATLASVLEIGLVAMELFIRMQGEGDLGETVTTENGDTLERSEEPKRRKLRTVFGEHKFEQYVYSRGAHRAIELYSIDARMGLSERVCSYLLEEVSQLFCIDSAFGKAATNLQTVLGQRLSVDTLEGVSRSMGCDAEKYLDNLPLPPPEEEGELLVATLDAKGVPLIRDDDGEKTKAFETRKQRPGNRRMATVAGVYSTDRHLRTAEDIVAALFREERECSRPRRPDAKYKHLSAHFPEEYDEGDELFRSTGAIEACCWVEGEVDKRRQANQPLVTLIDGEHHLWDRVSIHLPGDRIEILDIVHVSSYIWRASDVFCQTAKEREAFTRARLSRILHGGVDSVIRGLRCLSTRRNLRGEQAKKIARITNYLEAHARRMRYDEYLAAGYPIATGVIEGACRHLVKDRMERSGMRWTERGAKAMLNVRAVFECARWEEFHAQRREEESQRRHPNRGLLDGYHPLQLAI